MSSIIVIKVFTNNIQVAFIVSNHLPILRLFQELTNCIRNKIEMWVQENIKFYVINVNIKLKQNKP